MGAFSYIQPNQTGQHGRIHRWIEVWDYSGDAIYRGFVAENNKERTLFVFFENSALDGLKSGYVKCLVSPWTVARVSPFVTSPPISPNQIAEPSLA
jgi:hypothetical protein